ncbi:MAG: hypothetical protein AB7T20_01870 [Steroidobacteraceae bacterium]
MRIRLQLYVLLVAALTATAPAFAQQSALIVPRNLEQLTGNSAAIVRGSVISVRLEKHPELTNLDTVVVTLRVRETLKGQASDDFVFRQYIWGIRDRMNALGYKKGQDVLLMMIAPSRYGLSSPAGVEQGRFRIERDASGREFAVNSHDNLRLFDGVGAQIAKEGAVLSPASASLVLRHRRGPVELRELTALIRELAARSE